MTSTQIIKQNQGLERKVDQLTTLCADLLKENARRSHKLTKLIFQQVETNNKILEIYLLLCIKTKKNVFLETDSKNTSDILDNMRVLVKALLHDNESFERENKLLRSIVHKLKNELKKGSI